MITMINLKVEGLRSKVMHCRDGWEVSGLTKIGSIKINTCTLLGIEFQELAQGEVKRLYYFCFSAKKLYISLNQYS